MPAAKAAPVGQLTHKQIMTILGGLLLGMFLAALDQSIVTTAIRRIGDDLHGLSLQAWATTAFLITSTITTPLYGKLSDIYGRRPLFMIAITVFVVGSALCGLADSMYMLAVFRAVQGIGAGGLFSLALAIMADMISPRERAKYMGYFMGTFASASVLGPVIGGFLSGQDSILGLAGWRWIFWVNVPIGALALVVVAKNLRLPHTRLDHRIDWVGALSLVVGLVPLLLIAEQGRTWGWGSPAAIACYVLGIVGIVAFFVTEHRMGDEALIPLRLFKIPTFAVGTAQATVVGLAMFGGMASLPLYLQIVKGASPTEAGLLMLPMMVGVMGASMTAGRISGATGRYKIFPIIGSVLLVVGLLLLHFVDAATPLWQVDVYMLVFGAGLGLNMQTIMLALQNAVPAADMGVATSSGTFFRQVGGTLGTAVFLSILFATAPGNIGDEFAKAGVVPPPGVVNLDDTSHIETLPAQLKDPMLAGLSTSMGLVFLVGAIVAIGAFVLSLLLKEVPLRMVSGLQAAREEAAAAAAAASVSAEAIEAVEGPALGKR